MDKEFIECMIDNESEFKYRTVLKLLDMHKLDNYLSKRYWINNEDQMDLNRYLSIEFINRLVYPVVSKDDKIFETASDSLLITIAKFFISKYDFDTNTYLINTLSNKMHYGDIIEKYILANQVKPIQAKIILDTVYYIDQRLFYNDELVSYILKIISDSRINIANLEMLYYMIINDYIGNIVSHYIIDCCDRCIADEINMYNYKQLLEIYKGMKSKINWKAYAYYMISENNMKLIRQLLESGMNINFDNDEVNVKFKVFDNKNKKY